MAYWWGVSLTGVIAALWMGNGCIKIHVSPKPEKSYGLWLDFSADSASWLIAFVMTTFTPVKTVKAQDFHEPKLCKARIRLNNASWEADLKICPETDHSRVACSVSSRTACWASGCTFLTPFSHLHLHSLTRSLYQHGQNRHLYDCREDSWWLLYMLHLLVPWSLLGRTGCGPGSHTTEIPLWVSDLMNILEFDFSSTTSSF